MSIIGQKLFSPFPFFGGKRAVAKLVWDALGNPAAYLEPFFGSGAVLLARPNYDQTRCETVCDKDGFISNVWRALKFSPDETAEWCDWPVNHADLNARRKKLIANEEMLLENLCKDPEWHDPKLAGYWIWAASCWIGSGLTRPNAIPHLGSNGMGVHGITENIHAWFAALSFRLRHVRVICGDWTRVCGGNWQDNMGDCGIFFDPPYGVEDRDTGVYHCDSTTIAADVMAWAKERGELKSYRIVIAGYEEYAKLLECGWEKINWKAAGGYSNTAKGDSQGKGNCNRETLYFSPHCLREAGGLFD
jgi:hypothetical protein